MGVFKWLRRERVTVTTHRTPSPGPTEERPNNAADIGTIRTDEYKRDLAEFQARRSSVPNQLPDTPVKKKCGRHSLPISCTDCTDPDKSFNYEKKSAVKYKKRTQKRARSANPEDRPVPNIQFLFQNQVFMPGTLAPYSEPQRSKKYSRRAYRSPDNFAQKHIDFKEDELQAQSPPFFYKNNSLPYDIKNFLNSKSDIEEVDGMRSAGEAVVFSHSLSEVSRDGSSDNLWEVMSELKNFDRWADEQLQVQSANHSKTDDSKSETSTYGLSLTSASNLDVNLDKARVWSPGKWGVVPVQIKTLTGVSVENVRRKRNTEINILRKCRHPNIILLMGLYPDVHNNINIICERCVDTLYDILHDGQGRILTAQSSVQYTLDISNALVFLRMQGYLHTELTSKSIMITRHDSAKLADLGPCVKILKEKKKERRYEIYSPEPQYVNIDETRDNTQESEPLISQNASETYLRSNSVAKDYKGYETSNEYNWHAPELFEPDSAGYVYPCNKSDVYSLCLILWESCNAKVPWNTLTYDKLKEQYTLWKAGIPLPQDGTYPGGLLALLQDGLKLQRTERIDLETLQNVLQTVKHDMDKLDYIIIPADLPNKKSNFSSVAWDTSPTDSGCMSPVLQNIKLQAVVHNRESSTESEKDCSKSDSPVYESIPQHKTFATSNVPQKCYVSDDEDRPVLRFEHLPEKEFSSACSTPIAKIRARIKDIGTPGKLHRSDSTEYCSIFSPDNRTRNFTITDESGNQSNERPAAKLSRSFTPKSYKPLHIKVPEYNLDCLKSLPKDKNANGRSSYNFDIKNYSLPTTPIARSNKLRKNAWLSGELSVIDKNAEIIKEAIDKLSNNKAAESQEPTNKTSDLPTENPAEIENVTPTSCSAGNTKEHSPESIDNDRFSGLKRIQPLEGQSPETPESNRDRTSSWSFKPSHNVDRKSKVEDVLAGVNVKPLVAIHEKWIFEANRKTGRSMSLPENNRNPIAALKPASHCVDTLQHSLPQLNIKKPGSKCFIPSTSENDSQWTQFCQARDNIAKKMSFAGRDSGHTWRKDVDKSTITTDELRRSEPMVDQATDTHSIEDFIRDLIRKELQNLFLEMQDDASSASQKTDELLDKGVANIMEHLKNEEEKKEPVKSFSRVKINGNNKPLLQITFSRSGENSLQVLDNCVNVTICDSPGKDKNQSLDETTDDGQVNALKRCQAFNALQEARSTEDLYIDDELSTQLHDNFGKMRLIPLHGSLHEILCEKADDCCLIKVKQENGCDTIYFRCDHETDSRDSVDGQDLPQDTVVFKRSISLVEERIQRIFPNEKRSCRKTQREPEITKVRPKSEVLFQNIRNDKRFLSNSSPSLAVKDDAFELNIENMLAYQDSSSDECLRCQAENDDFEYIERKIEEDLANSNISTLSSLTCGCLEKISEENLSAVNEDTSDKQSSPDPGI